MFIVNFERLAATLFHYGSFKYFPFEAKKCFHCGLPLQFLLSKHSSVSISELLFPMFSDQEPFKWNSWYNNSRKKVHSWVISDPKTLTTETIHMQEKNNLMQFFNNQVETILYYCHLHSLGPLQFGAENEAFGR